MVNRSQTHDLNGDALGGVRDLVRLGVVHSVDLASARCVVDLGDGLITGPIPWTAARAGALKIWTPPTPGEQLLVFAPEGDLERAVAGPSLFCNANAAPAADARTHIQFPDGATVSYDPAAGVLDVTVISQVLITAPTGVSIKGKVVIEGDVEVEGKIHTTGDVLADKVSLQGHKHTAVTVGTGISGPPQVPA